MTATVLVIALTIPCLVFLAIGMFIGYSFGLASRRPLHHRKDAARA